MKYFALGILLIAQAAFGQLGPSSPATTTDVASRSGITWSTATGTTATGVVSSSGTFLSSNGIAQPVQIPTIKEVRASALPISDAELAPASYIRQAKSFGMDASAEEATMIRALHDAGLHVYDYGKVDEYLRSQAADYNAVWGWSPMRRADAKATAEVLDWQDRTEEGNPVFGEAYGRSVPAEIIARAKAFLDCEPSAILLVSDFRAPRPDPFLAVTTKNLLRAGKVWIVAQWDEPGFHEAVLDYQQTPVKKQTRNGPFAWLRVLMLMFVPYAYI